MNAVSGMRAAGACRRCGAPLVPEPIAWNGPPHVVAWSCSRCGTVRFAAEAARPASTEVVEEAPERGDGGYRAKAAGGGGDTLIVRRWRRPIHVVLIAFAALGVAAPIVLAALGFPQFFFMLGQFWQITLALPVVFYLGLCGLVNSTRIELHDGLLRISHGPLPLRKARTLPAAELVDVWTQHVRVAEAPDIYRLRVAFRDGGELVVLDELPSAEEGMFLEEKIVSRLGIGS